jgi:hypothetical protein
MMNWKKLVCILTAIGAFLIWGNGACLWAGDADIINLLRQKNVITQEEADKALEELQTKKQDEKKEIKKELSAEIKDDIKQDATKGDLLPQALKGFRFSTTIFADWADKNATGSKATNQFELNRGYMTLIKDINDWLGVNVTADVFTSVDKNDVGNGLEMRMKNAYVYINLFDTSTQLGLIPTPSDTYDSAIWPYRVQGKNFLDDNSIQASADLGVSIQGPIGGYMDENYLQYASKQFAGKWGGYFLELSNGGGYAYPTDNNNNKVVSGLIYVRPLPTIPFVQGLQLAYTETYGESNANFAAGDKKAFPNWRVYMAQASFQQPMFTIMYQYYWGEGAYDSTDENNHQGYLLEGFVRVPMVEKLRVFGKCSHYDPNMSKGGDEFTTYTGGLSYDLTKEFMPFVAYQHRQYQSSQGGNNYDMYQIGFQFKI